MKHSLFRRFLSFLLMSLLSAPMLSAHAAQGVTSVVALGNSITRHGAAPQIKWFGDWGMAASSPEKDYVGRLRALLVKPGQSVVQAQRFNVAVMEREPKGFQLDPATSAIAAASSVLVVELGDNANGDALQDFDSAYRALLTQTKQKKGVLLCLSTWWNSAKVDSIIKPACVKAGGVFVEIGDIHSDPNAHPSKGGDFDDPGILNHPGDVGMAEIAKRLFAAYTQKSKS
jgi:hypothetical protein